jgi:hypothetical protein
MKNVGVRRRFQIVFAEFWDGELARLFLLEMIGFIGTR